MDKGLLGLLTAKCTQWNTALLAFSPVFPKTFGPL